MVLRIVSGRCEFSRRRRGKVLCDVIIAYLLPVKNVARAFRGLAIGLAARALLPPRAAVNFRSHEIIVILQKLFLNLKSAAMRLSTYIIRALTRNKQIGL